MKRLLFYLLILSTFVGCGRRIVTEELMEADSLIAAEKNDSAYMLLSGIKERYLVSEEDKAYYHLLMTRASLLTGIITPPDSFIDHAISYYEQKKDSRKLADAYYYKACQLHNQKYDSEAMLNFKEAGKYATMSHDLWQQYKITEAIAFLNGLYGNNNMKLKYSKDALNIALALQDSNRIAYSYYWISNAYILLEMEDSASIYARMIIPYLNNVSHNDIHHILTTIGNAYKGKNDTIAKKYYQKALSYKEISSALESLADIYYKEGNHEEAYRLWKRAVAIDDENQKDNIIYNILEYDIQHGNTDNVLEKVNEIMDIKDSIQNKLKNDTLKDLQLRFDHEVEKHELDLQLNRSLWAIASLVAMVIAMIIYVLFKRYQYRLLWSQNQIQIDNYTAQIRRLEASGTDVKEKIKELQAQIDTIMDDNTRKVNRGFKLYNDVKNNENMIRWAKEDYDMFISYFDVIDHATVKRCKKGHKNLTPRNLTFLLLCSMGKSDEDIRQIMSLSPEGLRSMRYRVNHD